MKQRLYIFLLCAVLTMTAACTHCSDTKHDEKADAAQQRYDEAYHAKDMNCALAVIYQTHEKELELNDAKSETRIHRVLLVAALLLILLIGYLFWRTHQYNKTLLEKNRRLVAEIEQREREEQQAIEQLKAEPEASLTAEQQLFRRICDLMDGPDHIYTDTDLDRNRLAQLLGTNEHYVTDAITTCTNGKNLSGFLNEYRLRYAARLLGTTKEPVALIRLLAQLVLPHLQRCLWHVAIRLSQSRE